MNEFKNRSKTGRIPPGKQQKVIRGTFTDKNVSTPSPSSARKNVRTPVASSLKPNQDLEKMRADLNTISDRLDDVENKLPVLNTKISSQDKSIKHSDKTSKGNISARSVHSVYNAQDFFEENQVKIKSSTRLSNEVYEEQPLKMEIPKTEQKRKNLVINIQRELKEWKQSRSKTRSVQTELTTEDIIKDTGYDQEEALNRVSPSSAAVNEPSVPTPRPPEDHLNKKDESSKEPTFKYPLDQFLPQHFRDEDESELKNGGVKDWLTKVNMDEEVPRDLPVEMSLPPPRHVLNQSAEYQVIEKAAQLLKKVEQHWKKSLFQNRLQLSPISESLNSSESENYIERLAAIKFRDAAYKKPTFCGTDAVNRNAAMNSREQNFLMSYDVVSNYFDIMGTKKSNANDSRDRNDENQPAKCPRCLAKTGQKKSVSVLENQQFVLKQNTYGRRSNLSRQSRGGSNVQISPRSNDSLQSNRTYASAYSSPRIKSNLFGERARMSTSNPDLRTINKECTHVQKFQNSKRCYCCGNKSDRLKYKATLNKSESSVNADNLAINTANNVSVINVKSSNQDGPSIPEVNPRKLSIAQDKMIIIQHLPQVDIRPELSKQTGPVICIEAEQQTEEIKESKNNNIGVFNYIHKNKSKVQHYREFKPFSNYSKYRSLTENPNCSEEEFFAAQLELRSVAENFIFRLKKNDNPSGYILMSTLLRLMDEVSELIDTHLNGTGFAPTDSNLPPRMEMVSDLLSDELKTWGAQHPQHYQRLNNIIQHLILDIQFIKNGNIDTLNAKLNERPSSSHYDKAHKKSSILKTTKRAEFSGDHSGRHRYASTSDSNFDRDRSDLTYRSRNSEEISLSDKLLHENALKVLRLEKAYKINHKARTLKWKEEERNSKENLPKIEITAQYSSTTDEGNKDNSADDSGRQQSLLSSDNSTPVVAIISPNESIEEHHDKTISDRSVSEDDKSIAEDIEDEKESDSIPEEQDEDDRSRLKEDQQSQDHQSDKQPESEGEEEVQEVISDSSQAVDKHKDSGGSDYDEDFEPELTEQPSQSVTATSSHHNDE